MRFAGDSDSAISAASAVILRGARVAIGPRQSAELDVEIAGRAIRKLGPARGKDALDLSGHILLPGLINAHDHLEFNLFPRLGRGPYPNATAWARDVYRPDEPPVRDHRRIPKAVRLYWGGLKNLVSGVTTVCHHNPYQPAVFNARFPVRVVRELGWAHSIQYSPDLCARYRRTAGFQPFVIHAAEGTDASAREEIFTLDRLGVLGSRTVLVHGVGLDRSGWRLIKKRAASLIACPASNLFTLGRTLPQSAFRMGVPIALGSDSAVTASGDLLDELRLARRLWRLSASHLYRMVTDIPASILRLGDGQGALQEGGVADLIAVRTGAATPAEALLAVRAIELVVISGRVRLVSQRLASRLPREMVSGLQPLLIEGRGRALVDADVHALYGQAAPVLGRSLRLAGRAVRFVTV